LTERIQRICAYGIHVLGDTILLVRASDLTEVAGRWFLPGGGVDFAEHPVDALRREVAEETGLTAEIGDQIGVVSDVRTRRNGIKVHSVRLIYRIDHVSGDLAHETSGSSDLAAFVGLDEARRLTLAHYVLEAGDLLGVNLRRGGAQVPS
jgi:ADP-ribose pyrophosphatase YjhB (NUDIX family)